MLKEEDLKILNHLLDSLKGISSINYEYFSKSFKENFSNNLNEKERHFNKAFLDIDLKIKFLYYAGILVKYGVGSIDGNSGYLHRIDGDKTYYINFNEIYKQEQKEEVKRIQELKNIDLTNKLNNWLIKSKWVPHIISGITIIITIFTWYLGNKKEKELEGRIQIIENSIQELKNAPK